jgi:hypothetical protein
MAAQGLRIVRLPHADNHGYGRACHKRQPQFSQLLYQPCPQVPPKGVVAQPDREQGGPWAALLMRASTLA